MLKTTNQQLLSGILNDPFGPSNDLDCTEPLQCFETVLLGLQPHMRLFDISTI